MTDLFSAFDLGGLTLPNRIVMAPMTRARAGEDGVPTSDMHDYYLQRASAGLIITECTRVSEQGHGVIRGTGLHRADQVAGWKHVVDGVHAAGGRTFNQLWHCGRVSHPDIRDGDLPVAPSAIAAQGDFYLPTGRANFPVPRELATSEIKAIVDDFVTAAHNAKAAGFDGVELHGAFGYLLDQFLQDGANRRTDAYGGSIANRARLMLEVTEAVIGVCGVQGVGVRLSPSSRMYGMYDSDAYATFGHVIRELDALKIGYIHLCEPTPTEIASGTVQVERVAEAFRPLISVAVIANGGFTKLAATAAIAAGIADLVSFGVPYIANPDLAERLRTDAPLTQADPAAFFSPGPQGYSDYPPFMA